jgi:hypothetical protein
MMGPLWGALLAAAAVLAPSATKARISRQTLNVTSAGAIDAAGAAVAGDVLLFAGGKGGGGELADVVVFKPGGTFSVMKGALSVARAQMASTQLADGSTALFGGGEDSNKTKIAAVDMYDAAAGTWSVAQLSQPRSFLAAASVTLGSSGRSLSLFAGGEVRAGVTGEDSSRVDIWEHGKGWVVQQDLLSQPRKKLAAATAGAWVLIGGGYTSGRKASPSRGYSDTVDLYHAPTGTWKQVGQPASQCARVRVGSDHLVLVTRPPHAIWCMWRRLWARRQS